MTHNNTAEGKERARKNLLHEATVVKALGDHERLSLIFGVVTKNEPLCLVSLFHGVRDESITLHQAANASMLTPSDSAEIFLPEILCDALRHVHLRGYLHNDIKANNVVLERKPAASKKYNPILIDFGKSTKAAASSVTASVKRMAPEQTKTYLAPEVIIIIFFFVVRPYVTTDYNIILPINRTSVPSDISLNSKFGGT